MKYITSTIGKKIEFKLTGSKNLVIDPIVPTEVQDEEYISLEKRLGSQIKLNDVSTTSGVVTAMTPPLSTSEPVASANTDFVQPENVTATVSDADEDGEPKDVE